MLVRRLRLMAVMMTALAVANTAGAQEVFRPVEVPRTPDVAPMPTPPNLSPNLPPTLSAPNAPVPAPQAPLPAPATQVQSPPPPSDENKEHDSDDQRCWCHVTNPDTSVSERGACEARCCHGDSTDESCP